MIAKLWIWLTAGAVAAVLAACSTGGPMMIGDRTLSFPWDPQPQQQMQGNAPSQQPDRPLVAGESFGRGPVKVALLLPLSGDPGLVSVGVSLANASKLAISFIGANPNIGEHISISLVDTGSTAAGASQAASAAVQGGASLILGPLRADQVTAAGAVARASGIPLIGFSNTSSAAGPGVYLLSVLPEAEMKRSLGYLVAKGQRGFAGAFANTEFGAAQARAFRQAVASIGLSPVAVYSYGSAAEARAIVQQAQPMLKSGYMDTLFVPDRATAPDFGLVLQQAGVSGLQVVGSADWEGDGRIAQTPGLDGAIYPAVDPAGLMAIAGDYQARFGAPPHPLATLAYTATILANVNTLSMSTPRYSAMALTAATGFNGRDGVFRFLANGQSEYGLAIRQLGAGSVRTLEGPRL